MLHPGVSSVCYDLVFIARLQKKGRRLCCGKIVSHLVLVRQLPGHSTSCRTLVLHIVQADLSGSFIASRLPVLQPWRQPRPRPLPCLTLRGSSARSRSRCRVRVLAGDQGLDLDAHFGEHALVFGADVPPGSFSWRSRSSTRCRSRKREVFRLSRNRSSSSVLK